MSHSDLSIAQKQAEEHKMQAEITIKEFSSWPIIICGYGEEISLTREESLDLYSKLEKAIHKTGDLDANL
jgi:hypothetical protein